MPQSPLDYAGPQLRQQRKMRPAVKWSLIVIVCFVAIAVVMIAYLNHYFQSMAPYGD
jgi:uncharacterized BrkB/YihY/UPF0761 family membrane protein